MKTHITLIRNTAAAFLLLQAAGILHATDIPAKTEYTITRDTKNDAGVTVNVPCCDIALSIDKVQYNLTVPANTYSGYTAAYEDNSGNWMILQPINETTEWNAVTDATKKEKLAKLFKPVLNQDMEISTTDKTTVELTSTGYIVQSESPALPAEISGTAANGINLPTVSGGRFYLAEYGTKTKTGITYLLTFKTSGSFMDLEAEAISKELSINSKELTKKQIIDNMFAWLDAKDKKNCAYPALSEKLAEMLAASLEPDNALDGIYTENGNEYIKLYLDKFFNEQRNIYADKLHNSDSKYNPKDYGVITDTGRIGLADQAAKIGEQKGRSRKRYKKNSTGRVFLSDCIEQCGLSGITGSPAFGKLLTDKDSLEELTEYIPELKNIQRGDIITELVSDKKETIENCGIVTAADGTGSTDGIEVVWLRSGLRYVEKNTLSKFGRDVSKIRCRRLLMVKNNAEKYEHAESWDVLDKVPASAELEIGSMSEESQVSSERWRWIPNTGEYLVLRRLKLQLKNKSGMKLGPVTGSTYKVTITGAYDRNYDSNKASEGNVYNNKANNFDIALLDEDNTVKNKGRLYNPHENSDTKRQYDFEITDGTTPVLTTDTSGNIVTADGKNVSLGIRPESSTKAYPGDDLQFTFTAEEKKDNAEEKKDNGPKLIFTAKDSDYIAVYDKKLLWRANLYIEQTESALGSQDWNNAHPWNAPPAAGVRATELDPVWGKAADGSWDKDTWGYNEWNRNHDGSVTSPVPFNGLSQLAVGNGTQGIQLSSFTPVRPLSTTTNTPQSDTGYISGTVAYSFPDSWHEPPDAAALRGDAGSMDGPFDFNKKMALQAVLNADASWANLMGADGYRFKQARNQWPALPDGDSADIDRFNTVSSFNAYVGLPEGITEAMVNTWVAGGSGRNWKDYEFLSGRTLRNINLNPGPGPNQFGYTLAPGSSWWYYSDKKPGTGASTSAFIPSLGLLKATFCSQRFSNAYDENRPRGVKDQKIDQSGYYSVSEDEKVFTLAKTTPILAEDWAIEAGTDCIGFAERAAGYEDPRIYNWKKLPLGFAETGVENIQTQMNTYDNTRVYPIKERSTSYSAKIAGRNVEANDVQPDIEALRRIIPGDIFVKDSINGPGTTGDQNDECSNHIAIVASVPGDPYAISDPVDYMDQIILIEAEFTNKIQSVIKVLSLGDYNSSDPLPMDIEIYGDKFKTPGGVDAIKLNCQIWAVRRLKSETIVTN